MTNYQSTDEVRRIRARLDHPIIDSDGHLIEFLPLVRDLLVDLAGESVAKGFDVLVDSGQTLQGLSDEMRRSLGIIQSPWWGIPTSNTLDRATAMLPRLMYDRLDEIGIDVAVLYPTYGLIPIHLADDELRQAMAAAFNSYVAEQYAPYSDRLIPVACIPTLHAGGGDRRARACCGRSRPSGGDDGRRHTPPDSRRWPGGELDGRARPRLSLRLRPALASLRRARDLPNLPLDRLGMGIPHVDEQLRLQPHRQLRRRRRTVRSLPAHGRGATDGSPSSASPSTKAAPPGPATSTAT